MIATAVQVALWVVVMVVLSRWITRGRNQPLPPVEAHRLVQPRSILIVGLASLAFSLGCVVASVDRSGNSGDLIKAAAYGLLFAGIALALGGVIRILLVDGARYASEKVQERLDDDY